MVRAPLDKDILQVIIMRIYNKKLTPGRLPVGYLFLAGFVVGIIFCLIGIFVAIIIAVGIFILMNKTTLGYELKACGHNKNAAKYAGMNEKRNIMLSMAIAGGLAAIGASLYYLNGGAELAWNTYGKLPDNGFNGIPVALLASNNPIGVVFSSVFLRFIDKGGYNLAGFTAYNEYVSDLIIAVIIYFAGFSKLIKDMLSRRKAKAAVASAANTPLPVNEEKKEEDDK